MHGSDARTFGSLLDAWLRDGKQGRAATTLDGYRTNIESIIRPALGSKLLHRLTAKDLDAFYARLIRAGTTPAMVIHHHRVISAALRQAEQWGMVPVSVARNATPPRVPVKPLTDPSARESPSAHRRRRGVPDPGDGHRDHRGGLDRHEAG